MFSDGRLRLMATQPGTVEFILGQVAGAGDVAARKMFGEYTLYCDGKVVGLLCDEQLFVKSTEAGRTFLAGTTVEEKSPYAGAKPCLLIPGDRWEDREWLSRLIRHTADDLPKPRKRK
jgi:TfoX/Sxy family transcriptional regulator of competence genes